MEPSSATLAPRYDLGQVRYVTERFASLQGLRILPFGLYFLAMAAGDAGLVPHVRQGALDVSLPLLLLAVAGSWLIGRHYDRRSGRVAVAKRSEPGAGFGAILGATAFLISGFVDARLEPPVAFSSLFIGGCALAYWYGPLRRRRPHWAALGALFVVLGLSPLVTGSLDGPPLDYVTHRVVMGGGLIVCGILDHLMLARTLRPIPAEEP